MKLRASQINVFAYCVDMHAKDLRAAGETDERLYMLPAWRRGDRLHRGRAGARWRCTEAVTLIAGSHVPEDVEDEARRVFDPETYAAQPRVRDPCSINTWNGGPGRHAAAPAVARAASRSTMPPPWTARR